MTNATFAPCGGFHSSATRRKHGILQFGIISQKFVCSFKLFVASCSFQVRIFFILLNNLVSQHGFSLLLLHPFCSLVFFAFLLAFSSLQCSLGACNWVFSGCLFFSLSQCMTATPLQEPLFGTTLAAFSTPSRSHNSPGISRFLKGNQASR